MLSSCDTVLLLIDVQEKLLAAMHERERLVRNLVTLVRGVQVLRLPIVWTEQYPKGLGRTVAEVAELMPGGSPLEKLSFSCCGDAAVMQAIEAAARTQVLLAGIEAHVCVCQTAMDLAARGYEPHVVADAVSSRTPENRQIGIERARDAGAGVTSVESALFEMLGVAEGPEFKEILRLVR